MDLRKQADINKDTRKLFNACAVGSLCLLIAACSSGPAPSSKKGAYDPKYGVSASARVATKKGQFRKGGGHYKIGRPYKVAGKTYVPKDEPGYVRTGMASWYGDDFHGRLTANGEIFDMHTLTAAHPTLPLPSYARVTNLKNGRSVIVRINDRGPYAHKRVIDLSKRVAEVLNFKNDGITKVRVKYIGKARMDGQDARYLEASFRKKGQRIGDDFRAVPKEGERRVAPTIMMASATQPQKPTPKKTNNTSFALAHLPPLGSPPSAPSPIALAAAPTSGWAPVDLVGDGYFPPSGMGDIKKAPIKLAQMSPIQLFYAKTSKQRVSKGHQAIAAMFGSDQTSHLADALARKAGKSTKANSGSASKIGTFNPAYALRIAEEFAALAAVQTRKDRSGQVHVEIAKLKRGVQWQDIAALKKTLGL